MSFTYSKNGMLSAEFLHGKFIMVGAKKRIFLPRINILKGLFFFQNPLMNYGLLKSTKIGLSKSIFEVKNQLYSNEITKF